MVKKILPPIDDKNQIANLASAGDWKSEFALSPIHTEA